MSEIIRKGIEISWLVKPKNIIKMIIAELFAGIGGMRIAYELVFDGESTFIPYEIHTNALSVYQHRFHTGQQKKNMQTRNITGLSARDINVDVLFMSPPCQPHTVQKSSLEKDDQDKRSASLSHILDILESSSDIPKYILVENVAAFAKSEMRNRTLQVLKMRHFFVKEFILNPKDLNIPNSRNRYYLLARLGPFDNNDCITTELKNVWLPEYIRDRRTIECFLDSVGEEFNVPDHLLQRHGNVFDVVSSDSTSTNCFTKNYFRYVEGTGSVVKIADKIRYFTPLEISRLMGFPLDFSFPNDMTIKQQYKLIGNSLNVVVVANLMKILFEE